MTELQTSEVELDKMTLEEAVAHYGVKGMKWGVRKDDKPKPRSERRQRYDELRSRPLERMSVKGAAKKQPVETTRVVKEGKSGPEKTIVLKRKPADMDPEDLKLAVERLRLEREYANLKRELAPTKVQKMMDILEKPIKIGTDVAVQAAREAAQKKVRNL